MSAPWSERYPSGPPSIRKPLVESRYVRNGYWARGDGVPAVRRRQDSWLAEIRTEAPRQPYRFIDVLAASKNNPSAISRCFQRTSGRRERSHHQPRADGRRPPKGQRDNESTHAETPGNAKPYRRERLRIARVSTVSSMIIQPSRRRTHKNDNVADVDGDWGCRGEGVPPERPPSFPYSLKRATQAAATEAPPRSG